MILGAHMSIAGGVHRALERGASVGCEAVQIFTRNQLRWHAPPLRPAHASRFRALAADRVGGIVAVLAHGSYLINLASPNSSLWRRSVAAMAEELNRCNALGVGAIVVHPGAHGGTDPRGAAGRLRDGLQEAYASAGSPPVRILLETTAGAGTTLGGSFGELADLVQAVSAAGVPCAVCLDTCHVFAAGYDLRSPETYNQVWRRFDDYIGREHLAALHLNDSRGPLGSRVDRHRHVGEGAIGLEGFRFLVNDPRLAGLPGILETPKGRDLREDAENLATLRNLVEGEADAR